MTVDHIHWLGHATFRVDDGAATIYIDPWKLPAGAPKADVILITHAHFDHYSAEDIAKIEKPTTVFVAPADVASKLTGKHVVTAAPGGSYQAGALKVTAVAAYNTNKDFHPKANGWVGYVVTLSTGQRIYHTGDSDVTPEMKAVQTDVALMPCGGTYTMTGGRGGGRRQRVQARGSHPDALGRHRRIARRRGRRGEGVCRHDGDQAGRTVGVHRSPIVASTFPATRFSGCPRWSDGNGAFLRMPSRRSSSRIRLCSLACPRRARLTSTPASAPGAFEIPFQNAAMALPLSCAIRNTRPRLR